MPEKPHAENPKATALVTGSSSGIGRAIARRLARDGFHLIIHCHRNRARAEETLALIVAQGGTAEVLQFDVKDGPSVEMALDAFAAAGGTISALVNNAGLHRDGLLGMLSDESFDEVMRTNAYGPFYLMRWCVRKMLRARAGCIVNIASLAGQTGNPGQANYAASKAALIAMTKSLAMEVGTRGIRVNAVAPGFIETEMLEGLPIAQITERIPLKRLGTPDEVAGAVSFLCSKDASYITGHTLGVNGGLFPA